MATVLTCYVVLINYKHIRMKRKPICYNINTLFFVGWWWWWQTLKTYTTSINHRAANVGCVVIIMFLLELLEILLSCVVYFHSRIKYMLVNTKYYLLVISEHLFLDVATM